MWGLSCNVNNWLCQNGAAAADCSDPAGIEIGGLTRMESTNHAIKGKALQF